MGRLKMKEKANTITHFVMFIAGIVGLVLMIFKAWGMPKLVFTVSIFGLSIITLYGASSIYHWVITTPQKELLLRKFDHISIYFLIAGTYTPILSQCLEGTWKRVMLSTIWLLSIIGAVLKVWFMKIPRYVSTILYIVLGWLAVIPIRKLMEVLPTAGMVLLFAGGIAYTFGGIIYATKIFNFVPNKFGFHEVFHIFVGLGTVLHFLLIYLFVIPA
ncbi:MAG: hemolysin III family protein [Firmicutes bacterium]|nr:hemolysin III family protein [Bacillota bacterium]